METRDNDERKKEQRTPIIDGDARPDINLFPEDDQKRDHPIAIPKKSDNEVTTKNRNDANSLEDFRDAKQE